MNGNLVLELKEKCVIHPQFLFHDEGDEESAITLANGASTLYAFCQHHNNHMKIPHHGHGDGFKTDDMRLHYKKFAIYPRMYLMTTIKIVGLVTIADQSHHQKLLKIIHHTNRPVV